MTKNKIKSLLSLKGFSFSDWAKHLNITPKALNTKKNKNQYKFSDLLNLADLTNTRLSFIDNKTNKELISFDKDDITVL